MSATFIGWVVVGAVVGTVHALALWRAASRWASHRWTIVWRLPATAVVLLIAATNAALLPAVTAWTGGFVAAGAFCLIRRP